MKNRPVYEISQMERFYCLRKPPALLAEVSVKKSFSLKYRGKRVVNKRADKLAKIFIKQVSCPFTGGEASAASERIFHAP